MADLLLLDFDDIVLIEIPPTMGRAQSAPRVL